MSDANTDTTNGRDHDAPADAPTEPHPPRAPEGRTDDQLVREMVRADREDHRSDRSERAGTTASADAVEALRRALRDLKHDVRMLKVGVDKQSVLLQRIAASLELRQDDQAR